MGCRISKNIPQPTEVNVFSDVNRRDSDTTEVIEIPALSEKYSFNDLNKVVFKIGLDCVTNDGVGLVCGRVRAVQVCDGCFGQKYLQVSLTTIKSNGKVFLQDPISKYIANYDGKMRLSELQVRPMLPEEKSRLKERGRLFKQFGLGTHYMEYSEKMFFRGSLGVSQISAEGRVMVDTSSFLHFNPNYRPLAHARRYLRRNYAEDEPLDFSNSPNETSLDIPESSLHLCWPTLCGFSFRSKRWGEISVASLRDIRFSDDAFSQLVLDDESKGMVKSLVENVHKETSFTDIIQGKGGGCIFLLHGPPGCGKTLTAEAVSEILHRPLYSVDVGELGITPKDVEHRLKEILEVAERWNAVILIDECDIFLASRSKDDVLRNAIVGIFLRLLEYHRGVLFLTSNRADDLDEAFQSRISISLQYDMLGEQSRKLVWENLLDAAAIKGLDSDQLAAHELNGRQIKTVIRLALSLAKASNEPVNQEHAMQAISYL